MPFESDPISNAAKNNKRFENFSITKMRTMTKVEELKIRNFLIFFLNDEFKVYANTNAKFIGSVFWEFNIFF